MEARARARAARGYVDSGRERPVRWASQSARWACVSGALVLLATGATAAVPAQASGSRSIEVVYRTPAALQRALEREPAALVRVVAPLHVAEVVPAGDSGTLLRGLRRQPGIVLVRPAVRRRVAAAAVAPALTPGLLSTPDGGAYEWQYYVAGVDRVPDLVRAAARRFTIAIVDSGVDADAPALAGKIAGTYDVRSPRTAVSDSSGHGTFVASLAAGSPAAGVAGFGGDARILVVKVGAADSFDDIDVAAGIVYAVRHGAKIINLSMAGRTRSAVEASAIRYAAARGALVVAAAGNDAQNGNVPEYPAALLQPVGSSGSPGLGLAVGASDFSGRRAPFSEFGSFVSLAAPGASVFGAVSARSSLSRFPRTQLPGSVGGSYGFASGTSFAAPEVAGAAALVWGAKPSLKASQVARILEQTASGHGSWNRDLGYGVIDVAAAVELAEGGPL